MRSASSMKDAMSKKDLYLHALEGRGDIFTTIGEDSKALCDYLTVKNNSRSMKARTGVHIKMCALYYRESKYAQAQIELEKIIKKLSSKSDTSELHAKANIELSHVFRVKGDYERSLKLIREALDISSKDKDKQGLASARSALGHLHWEMGNYDSALKEIKNVGDIFHELGDLDGESTAYNNLAVIYDDTGELSSSEKFYKKGLDISLRIGDIEGEAKVLINLAGVYWRTGRASESIDALSKTLLINEKLGNLLMAGMISNNLGLLKMNMDRLEESASAFLRSYHIFKRFRDKKHMALAAANLGLVSLYSENFKQAEKRFQESLKLSREINDRKGIGHSCRSLGNVYFSMENYTKSGSMLCKAHAIFKKMGEKIELIETDIKLSELYCRINDVQRSIDHANEAVKAAIDSGSIHHHIQSLEALGEAQLDNSKECGIETLIAAIELAGVNGYFREKISITLSLIDLIAADNEIDDKSRKMVGKVIRDVEGEIDQLDDKDRAKFKSKVKEYRNLRI